MCLKGEVWTFTHCGCEQLRNEIQGMTVMPAYAMAHHASSAALYSRVGDRVLQYEYLRTVLYCTVESKGLATRKAVGLLRVLVEYVL